MCLLCLQRPLTMEEGGMVLMDLLWSDPTTNDTVEGVQPSPRGPGLVTFGPDRVMEFCRVRPGWMPGMVQRCLNESRNLEALGPDRGTEVCC